VVSFSFGGPWSQPHLFFSALLTDPLIPSCGTGPPPTKFSPPLFPPGDGGNVAREQGVGSPVGLFLSP